jgi:PAS domain S-box-containing protein
MATLHRTRQDLERETADLRSELAEAQETLRAIRQGEVDALVVSTAEGDRVYTLESADQAYRVIIEQMQEGAVTIVKDGSIHYSNGRFADMVGIPLEQVLGSSLREDIAEGERFDELVRRAHQGGARGEVGLRHADRFVPAYLSLTPLVVHGRESLCVVVTDLSEQKRTEQIQSMLEELQVMDEEVKAQNDQLRNTQVLLEAERIRYQDLFDSAPDGYLVTDESGMILEVNRAALAMLGVDRKFARTRRLADFFSTAPQRATFHAAMASLDRATGPQIFEFCLGPGDGFLAEVTAEVERSPRGTSLRVRWMIRDVTERKRSEETLAKITDELKRSNQDLQQFAHTASHDLQEPLRAISGFLQLLESQYGPRLDHKGREFISYAVEGAKRMADLIRDLLAYSRVDRRGKKPEPVETEELLAMALANLNASIGEAAVRISHDPLPALVVDDMQLVQLFQNLIGNAIKFRKPDQPCLIHVGVAERDGQAAVFVRDNGIGIDPAQHERIFEIFQRLHKRGDYPGTGVGLAICKRIVDRHRGRIWVESQPDSGATFYFSLPPSSSLPGELAQ